MVCRSPSTSTRMLPLRTRKHSSLSRYAWGNGSLQASSVLFYQICSSEDENTADLIGSTGLPITEYTPSKVKLAVTGSGAARKEQVGFRVRQLLHLSVVPTPDDAADVAAIAICHAHALRIYTEGLVR